MRKLFINRKYFFFARSMCVLNINLLIFLLSKIKQKKKVFHFPIQTRVRRQWYSCKGNQWSRFKSLERLWVRERKRCGKLLLEKKFSVSTSGFFCVKVKLIVGRLFLFLRSTKHNRMDGLLLSSSSLSIWLLLYVDLMKMTVALRREEAMRLFYPSSGEFFYCCCHRAVLYC